MNIPIGMAMIDKTNPSKYTEHFFCFGVAPTLDNIPRYCIRSLVER